VIEPAVYIALGVLCAAFVAALIVPALLRRTARLTERRVRESLPVSLEEIEADRDRLRAEHAMAIRRVEQALKALQERNAELTVELARRDEAAKLLTAERKSVAGRDSVIASLSEDVAQRDARIEALQAELNAANELAERRASELSRLRGLLDEAHLLASTRQVEIEAQDSQIGSLTIDLAKTRDALAAESVQLAEARSASASLSESLQAERRRVAELTAKSERMYADLADREAALQKREGDLAQLREALAGATRTNTDLEARLSKALAEKARLEAKLAESEQRRERPPLTPEEEEATVARLVAERRRLEERLAIVTRQNQKLRADLAAGDPEARQATAGQDRAANAVLREQIAQIAAEMAHLVEKVEGKDSPILRLVPPGEPATSTEGELSLADRIRALRAATSS
jgi:chromosome segregation ATPase